MDQGVQIQALGFAPVVHVLEQRVELVRSVDGEGLTAGFLAAGAANRRLQRQVRVRVAAGQVKLHFRRDDRFPAFLFIQLEHRLEDVAWRHLDGVAHLVETVVNDLSGWLQRPRHGEHGGLVRFADHVDVGRVEQVVIDVVFYIVASYRLQQDALGQAHALFRDKLHGGRDLAAGNAGQVADHAFHFGNLVFFQPGFNLVHNRLRVAATHGPGRRYRTPGISTGTAGCCGPAIRGATVRRGRIGLRG